MIERVELESARLRIRHFETGDIAACIDFRRRALGLREEAAAAQQWLDWTISSYRQLAQLYQPPYADYAVVLRADGRFIGSVGIVPMLLPWGRLTGVAADRGQRPEVGLFWAILPEYRRQGYASEAGARLIDFLFQALQLRQVVASTTHDNLASQNTMKKLGLRLYQNSAPELTWCQVVGVLENTR